MSQGKYWCFTWNNFDENYKTILRNSNCIYLVFGIEVGESGTEHLQGYIEFESNKRLAFLKKIHSAIHWEKRIGTASQAAEYCKKDGRYEEFGEISKPSQGARKDIDKVRDLVSSGAGMKDIVTQVSSYQAIRYGETLLKYVEIKRTWKPEVKWFHGPTGAGKTKRAMEEAKNPYVSGRNLKWWEGYDAHEDVIIDDFRKDFCTFHELLRILDRYEYRIEVKGSSRQLLAKRIWITSCYMPEDVYDTREDVAQLLRRIDFIIGIGTGIEVAGNTDTATLAYTNI